MPGETAQEQGRDYLFLLSAALETYIQGFRINFTVIDSPAKLTFPLYNGSSYSFDANGIYDRPTGSNEVWVEFKGYTDGAKLLGEYKRFIARAYATAKETRHSQDLYWFVANVPFGCAEGSRLSSADFIERTLCGMLEEDAQAFFGKRLSIDYARGLQQQISFFIFTDDLMRETGLCLRVRRGDTVWRVAKRLHGDRIPTNRFDRYTMMFSALNNDLDPDHILADRRYRFPVL